LRITEPSSGVPPSTVNETAGGALRPSGLVDRPAVTVDRSSVRFRPVPVLRVGGELCLANAPLVEAATAKVLPEALLGLVLDLSDLRVGDELRRPCLHGYAGCLGLAHKPTA
jgi:hypothetical protein